MQYHEEAQYINKRGLMQNAIAYSAFTITMMKNKDKHKQQWCDKEVHENDQEEEKEVGEQEL